MTKDKNVGPALDDFVKASAQTLPAADALPAWKWADAYYGALVTRVSQVMAGEMSLDDAWSEDRPGHRRQGRPGEVTGRGGRSRKSHGSAPRIAAPVVLAGRDCVNVPLKRWQRATGTGGMAAFFLAPNMAIFGVFVLVPLVINFVYSMTSGSAYFLADRTFVGAEQYQRLLDCGNYLDSGTCREDLFWKAVHNTALFVVVQVALLTVVSLITALILNREICRSRLLARGVLLPGAAVAGGGRADLALDPAAPGPAQLHPLSSSALEPHDWLTDRVWAFAAAIGVSVWAHMGFYTLILLAGLQAIPRDLYEAAEMDGTRPARVFWRITLPLLMPNLLVVIVLALIRAVQIFDEVYVLTGGGPGTSTLYLTQYIYEVGFASLLRNPGLAAAASILMGAVLVVLTLVQLGLGRRNEKEGERE